MREGSIRNLRLIDTLLYIKYVNSKNLLYSTGNYIQCLVLTYNTKEWGKEHIYTYTHTHTYIYNKLLVVHLKLTRHLNLTILQFIKH